MQELQKSRSVDLTRPASGDPITGLSASTREMRERGREIRAATESTVDRVLSGDSARFNRNTRTTGAQ